MNNMAAALKIPRKIISTEKNPANSLTITDKRICDCPVETALNLISGKWKARILWKLHTNGIVRFGEMRKGLDGITQKMLTQQLRELEEDGLVKRKVYAEVPPRVEYSLTDFGTTLQPVMQVIAEWGTAHNQKIVKLLKQ